MIIGIAAAVMGLLFGSAAIIIPRLVNRRNDPDDHTDSLAYLKETGQSVQDVLRGNQDQPSPPENEPGR